MRQLIGKLASRTGLGQMSEGEYRANLSGINIFFGAVLGFVLAGIEKLNSLQFGAVLLCLAGVVVSIMYITGSRHRVAYSAYAIAASLVTPAALDFILKTKDAIPSKVMPTLLAWTLMTILVEFWSRESRDKADEK